MSSPTKIYVSLLGCFLFSATINAQTSFRPAPVPDTDPAFNNVGVVFTDDELADPPPGEIRKRYVNHDVNEVRASLAANLAAAPEGAAGLASPWMAKFQTLQTGLDQIASSRSQRDVFNLIPKMAEIFSANSTLGYSDFFAAQGGLLRSLGVTIIHAMAEHVSDKNAIVTPADLANFVTVFSQSGFILSSDWENEAMPIDAAGVMILDPASVVAQLKAAPWQSAELFLNGCSATDAFEQYTSSGGGLNVLKTKFAADQADVLAKWNELAAWVAEQKSR